MQDLLNAGQVLGRSEMKKIMAGSGGYHACHCYCCPSGEVKGPIGGAACDPDDPSNHDWCQSECETYYVCHEPEYVCALCKML